MKLADWFSVCITAPWRLIVPRQVWAISAWFLVRSEVCSSYTCHLSGFISCHLMIVCIVTKYSQVISHNKNLSGFRHQKNPIDLLVCPFLLFGWNGTCSKREAHSGGRTTVSGSPWCSWSTCTASPSSRLSPARLSSRPLLSWWYQPRGSQAGTADTGFQFQIGDKRVTVLGCCNVEHISVGLALHTTN